MNPRWQVLRPRCVCADSLGHVGARGADCRLSFRHSMAAAVTESRSGGVKFFAVASDEQRSRPLASDTYNQAAQFAAWLPGDDCLGAIPRTMRRLLHFCALVRYGEHVVHL